MAAVPKRFWQFSPCQKKHNCLILSPRIRHLWKCVMYTCGITCVLLTDMNCIHNVSFIILCLIWDATVHSLSGCSFWTWKRTRTLCSTCSLMHTWLVSLAMPARLPGRRRCYHSTARVPAFGQWINRWPLYISFTLDASVHSLNDLICGTAMRIIFAPNVLYGVGRFMS